MDNNRENALCWLLYVQFSSPAPKNVLSHVTVLLHPIDKWGEVYNLKCASKYFSVVWFCTPRSTYIQQLRRPQVKICPQFHPTLHGCHFPSCAWHNKTLVLFGRKNEINSSSVNSIGRGVGTCSFLWDFFLLQAIPKIPKNLWSWTIFYLLTPVMPGSSWSIC